MNSLNSIIETPTMTSTGGAAPETAQFAGTGGQEVEIVTSQSAVPVLEWAGMETYLVTVQGASQSNSAAFRLSF